ncbi:MAG: hypothetical protein FJY48_08370 [Betaproteobacteria bacterium]|nr:hypothetical protein [Betaproteobacteria bacterium]
MNFEKVMVGLCGSVSSGLALAHGAGYDHTHSLLESPAVILGALVCAGVIVAVFKSSQQKARAISLKADQHHYNITKRRHTLQ